MGLSWNKQQVETFFGATFESKQAFEDSDELLHEMRFEAGKLKYWLLVLEQQGSIALHADPAIPDSALPAIEIQFHCVRINQIEATGVGPVLLFHRMDAAGKERVCLHVTRTKDHLYSLAPDFGPKPT